ncbi:centrosomal protein of 192 kDa isoform X1 [Lingula anatina]|uniref:Centrosomal protein of 192 kDa isoform X1 n=1 Tax=Lingula anatina TaxID=7574 RepID=A0A2R2MM95_LINAN|nr:centrosomal protein of 192 kDa isoform X1 [Lingula anatina]|eukprot:XP_023931341.1 centrosomal protein of 192 kDa isoform X1 [Lingula anatina]
MADSVVHISFTEEELNGLDGFDGLMDSFDDGEFFSGDNAQAILDDDEAAFEEEHKFDEVQVADNVADHTPHVADSSWMLPHGDVTFSAMVSHDGRDRSHDQSHGKVSFGQFIGTRTEALGTLEGDGLVPRPTFGTDFVTPPSDRKPVALLADIEERDSEQDVSIKENRIPHLDLNDSREMLGATEGIQTAYFKPAAAKTNKSVTAEETDGDQTLTASPSPPRLQQQGPIAGSPLTKLGTYSKSGVDRTLTESLSSSKGLRDSNIVAMTENRQSPLWKKERLTGERLQTQTTVFGQEKSRDGHNVRMETSSKLPQVSDGVGSPKGGGTPTRSAIPRLVQQSGAAKKSVGDTTNSRSRNMGQAGGKITPDHRDSYPVKQKEENSRVLAGSSSPSRIDDKPKTSVSCTKKPEKNYNSHAEQSMKNYHNYSVSKSSEPGSKVTLVPSDKRPASPRRYQQDDHRKMAGKSRILEKDSVMSSSESDSTGREERQKKQYSSPRRHKVALESPRVKKTQFAIGSSSSSVNSTEEQNNGSSPDTDNDNVSTVSETDSFHDSQSDAESVHSILEEVSMRVQPGAGIPDETTFLDQTGAVNISAISKYIASLSMSAPMDDIAEKVLKLSHKQRQEKPKPQMRQTESRPPPPGVNRDTAPPGVHKMSKGQAVKMERQTPPVNVVEFSKPSQSSVRDRKGTPVSLDASSVYSTSSTSMGYYNERGSRPPPPGDTTGQHHNVPSSSQGSSSAGTLVSKPSVAPTREVRTPPVGVTSEQDGPATTRSLQLERPSQSRRTTSKNTSLSEKSFQHDNKQKGPVPVTGRSPPGVSFKRSSQEVSERSPPGFRSGRSLAETNGRSPPGISTGHLGSPTGVSTGRSPTGVSTGGSPTGLSTRESPLLRTSTDYSSNERKTSPKPGSLETSSSPSLSPRQDHATFKENNVIHGGRREPKIFSETYDTYTIPSSVVKQLDYREREPPSGIFSDTGDKAPLMSQDFAETASQATSIWGSIEEYERRGRESPPYNQTRDSHSTVSTSSVNSSLDRQREGSSRHPHGMADIPLPTSQAFGTEHGRNDSSSTSSVLRSSMDQQYRSHPQGGSSVHSWQPQASDANRPAFTMNSQTPAGISHMREATWGSENLQYADSRQAMSIPADFRPQARSEPVGVSSIPPVSALFQENVAQTFVTPSSMHNLFATTTVPSGYQVPRDRQAQSYLSSTHGYQLPPSIHTPGELRLPGVCCVGLSSRTELTLHNPTDRWVQCGLELTSITVNGQVLDTVLNNPFVFKKLKVIVEPRTTERIALVFAPKYPGVYVGQLNIVTSPVVSDQPLRTSGLPSMVTIQAMAEEPNIQVKTGSEFGLDFGQLPYGSQKSLPLTVVNNGKAAVPLRLVISTNKSSWHCFTFDSEQASPDVSVISQTHRPVTPALARSIINLTIPGSGEHGHPTETHVPLFFRAPKQSFDRDHVPEIPEVLTATVVIEVDMPKSVAPVRSVSVRATVGVARLHAPRSLDSVVLQAAVGWSDTKLLPLRNAGNITLDVTLSIHDWPQLFTVFPTRLQLAPGMGEDVVVKYKAVDQQQRTYESALHMLVEPDGPAYETPLRGLTQSVTSRQTVSAPPSDHFSAQPTQQGFQQTDTGFSRGQDGHLPAEMTYPSREQMNNLQTTVFRQSDTGQSNMVQDSIPAEKVRSKASSASAGHPPQTLLCNKHFLSWGGVPVGRSLHQKTTLCNASDEMIKLRLRIKGCTPDFQLQVGSGDSERRCDERELILKPKEEYPVNVLFCPTRVAAFNTKLEIRPLTGRIKYPVPLYGYGGVSKLVLHGVKQGQGSAGSWASLGDMSGCSHCVTQVQLKNTGVRAAYVKALCFTDITCRQQLPVNKISVQPNECIIFPEEEKTVVIAFHPTERERILCSDNPSSVGAIGFFYGDEVSRKLFRVSKGRSKQLAAENPLCQVNFDVQYDGQDDINEDLGTATVPNAADLFYSTMSRIMLTLVGEPTPKMVARPDSIRDSLMPLMADESVADSTVANLDISFPVKGTPLVSRQKLTTDVNTGENWSINPPQLILETSRDTRGSHMKRVQLINYYDRPLRYELAWPDHCVKVTPQQGTVEPRTSVLVCVSASPTLYSRGIPLPWSGAVHISCDDGKTQTLRIQIRESLELPGPTEHTTEQHPFLKPPDILPQSVRMIFTPQQSSAANTGLQLIGPAIKTVTPIGSLPVASSSTSSPPRVTASQVVNFPDTCVGRTAETELTLRNTKDESVTWVLSSLAPPYIKGVSGSVEILRVKYAVFKLMKKSGVLEAQQQAVIPIQFSPREAGQYSQHWEVHTKPHSSLSTAAGLQSLRVQMFGEGTPASSAGSEEKENRPLVNNSDKPISMRTVEDSTLPCPPEEAVATLTLKSDHLTFPATTAGSCAIQKARVKNGTTSNHTVEVIPPQPPFHVKHHNLKAKSRHYISLPVEFRPTSPGSYKSLVVLRVDTGHSLSLQVYGECV